MDLLLSLPRQELDSPSAVGNPSRTWSSRRHSPPAPLSSEERFGFMAWSPSPVAGHPSHAPHMPLSCPWAQPPHPGHPTCFTKGQEFISHPTAVPLDNCKNAHSVQQNLPYSILQHLNTVSDFFPKYFSF